MIADPWFYPVAVIAVLLVGVSKAGFGGATGLMATPLMALFVPPSTAAAIMLPLLIAMDVLALKAYWGRWDLSLVKSLVPAAVAGIALGWATFGLLDDHAVALLLGGLCLVFAAQALSRQLRSKTSTAAATVRPLSGQFWGGIAGYTSFISHAGGPPLTAHMLALGLDKTTYQATTVIFYAAINAAKTPPYLALGLFDPSVLWTSAAPAAPVGIWLGMKLHGMVSERWFARVIIIALAATGLKLIADALLAAR